MNKLSLFNMLVAHFNDTSFFDYFYNTLKKIYYSKYGDAANLLI